MILRITVWIVNQLARLGEFDAVKGVHRLLESRRIVQRVENLRVALNRFAGQLGQCVQCGVHPPVARRGSGGPIGRRG